MTCTSLAVRRQRQQHHPGQQLRQPAGGQAGAGHQAEATGGLTEAAGSNYSDIPLRVGSILIIHRSRPTLDPRVSRV